MRPGRRSMPPSSYVAGPLSRWGIADSPGQVIPVKIQEKIRSLKKLRAISCVGFFESSYRHIGHEARAERKGIFVDIEGWRVKGGGRLFFRIAGAKQIKAGVSRL